MAHDYKRLRATLVIISNSEARTTVQDEHFARALAAAEKANYDFDVLDSADVEQLAVYVDHALARNARNEFYFKPEPGSIRDHKAAAGVCALCGKGDSKGDGTNRDHLRYDFWLQNNTATGRSLWVGARCIVNFGLRVDGAGTAAAASKILDRTLRQHISYWQAEEWREEHPDHDQIIEHYSQVMLAVVPFMPVGFFRDGDDSRTLIDLNLQRSRSALRTAMKFYQRRARLTPRKTADWLCARAVCEYANKLVWARAEQQKAQELGKGLATVRALALTTTAMHETWDAIKAERDKYHEQFRANRPSKKAPRARRADSAA